MTPSNQQRKTEGKLVSLASSLLWSHVRQQDTHRPLLVLLMEINWQIFFEVVG